MDVITGDEYLRLAYKARYSIHYVVTSQWTLKSFRHACVVSSFFWHLSARAYYTDDRAHVRETRTICTLVISCCFLGCPPGAIYTRSFYWIKKLDSASVLHGESAITGCLCKKIRSCGKDERSVRFLKRQMIISCDIVERTKRNACNLDFFVCVSIQIYFINSKHTLAHI